MAGNIARRTSIITPRDVYIDGPIRYVDDAGGPLWELRKKDTGDLENFDEASNSWSTMGDWDGPDYEYVQASDWESRPDVATDPVTGDKMLPVLGIVSGETIYISGAQENREIHGALFTSGDVVRPDVGTGKKKNLYTHGALTEAAVGAGISTVGISVKAGNHQEVNHYEYGKKSCFQY